VDPPAASRFALRAKFEFHHVVWESLELEEQPSHMKNFALTWRGPTRWCIRTRWTPHPRQKSGSSDAFDPGEIREMKESTERDLTVGGAGLRRPCLQGRVGRRVPLLPCSRRRRRRDEVAADGLRMDLELTDQRVSAVALRSCDTKS
jgi:hypothetical protein